ncbi:MAG: hypothetical protein ABSG80_13775 [Verrucomicrobiota bacterium]
MSDAIPPGAMAFTRTPRGETSVASVRPIPRQADFAAEPATTSGIPNGEAIEAANKMLPCS